MYHEVNLPRVYILGVQYNAAAGHRTLVHVAVMSSVFHGIKCKADTRFSLAKSLFNFAHLGIAFR